MNNNENVDPEIFKELYDVLKVFFDKRDIAPTKAGHHLMTMSLAYLVKGNCPLEYFENTFEILLNETVEILERVKCKKKL